MKKILLILAISLTQLNLSYGQIPEEAFTLTNSLTALWYNGETEKAVKSSIDLYRIYPPFFIERIHNSLSQHLQDDPNLYGKKYLENLHSHNNDTINQIIAPIYLWSRSITAVTDNDLKTIVQELNNLLSDSSNYDSNAERYCLLILQELDKKNAIDESSKEKILLKNINNLSSYPYIDNMIEMSRSEAEKRAWHRYLLAYSYDYLYNLNPSNEDYLKKASDYSPDQYDKQNESAYFYDAGLLTGNVRDFGFQLKYYKYLVENNRHSEALSLLTDNVFINPTDYNMTLLQDYYEKLNDPKPFSDYWGGFVNTMGIPVPKVRMHFEKEELDLTHKPNSWIFIDVWGTWCAPCLRELPEFQSFFVHNSSTDNSKLKIYTFSFGSQNLKDFMKNNSYTFPVTEIDNKTNNLFGITGYPTKILISPEGNFIKIPYGVDWKMYVKNYVLL